VWYSVIVCVVFDAIVYLVVDYCMCVVRLLFMCCSIIVCVVFE